MNSSGFETKYACSLNCNGSGGGGNGSASGYWVKHNGGGYISISGNTAKFCQESTDNEFIGSYNSSSGIIEVDFDDRTDNVFKAEINGDEMTLIQNYSSEHATETQYYSTSNYPCDGSTGSGNGSGSGSGSGSVNEDGTVTFYLTQDFGCGSVTVSVNGSGSKRLSQWVYGFVECNQNGTVSWTLAPGTYTYEASCSERSWGPASFTISEGGCLGYELK